MEFDRDCSCLTFESKYVYTTILKIRKETLSSIKKKTVYFHGDTCGLNKKEPKKKKKLFFSFVLENLEKYF